MRTAGGDVSGREECIFSNCQTCDLYNNTDSSVLEGGNMTFPFFSLLFSCQSTDVESKQTKESKNLREVQLEHKRYEDPLYLISYVKLT